MRTKLFLFALAFTCSVFSAQAQSVNELPENEEIYVLDGTNRSFVWGRHISLNKIAIGLTNEGVVELRSDNTFWIIGSPMVGDMQVAHIVNDNATGRVIFSLSSDTIGGFDPHKREIYDNNSKLLATINPKGEIYSTQGKMYVSVNPEAVDKNLAAFFLLYHYWPKQRDNELLEP